jgi:hypothetical protein
MERALLLDGPRDGEIRDVVDAARFVVEPPPRRTGTDVYERTDEHVFDGDDSDAVIFRHRPALGAGRRLPTVAR